MAFVRSVRIGGVMRKLRGALLLALGACIALPMMSAPPAEASEACAAGYVLFQTLPGCNNCPPGIFAGPSGVNPFISVFVCVHP
jgi:hypothetical protein